MLSQEDFDKLLQDFDIEKFEIENLKIDENFHKEIIKEIQNLKKHFNEDFYDKEIKATKDKIEDLNSTQDSEKLSQEDLSFFKDDKYIKKYMEKGYLSEEYVTGIAAQTNHKYQSEKKVRDEKFLQFLTKHLEYLEGSKKNCINAFNQMSKFIEKINPERVKRKLEKMKKLKEKNKYEEYKQKCEDIKKKFKNKMENFKKTFVKEDIDKFLKNMGDFEDEIKEMKKNAEDFYNELKNKKPTSDSSFWIGFCVGLGIGFAGGFAVGFITGVIVACI